MTALNSPAALLCSPNVIFIPNPLRVCGNCNFWIGPRVSYGQLGMAAPRGAAGSCCNRTRHREIPDECSSDATPMSSPDCPLWATGEGFATVTEGGRA